MRLPNFISLSLAALTVAGCTDDDSAIALQSVPNVATVHAFAETVPVPDHDDAADDPYIMVAASGDTIIAGTNKRRGVELYDLQGQRLGSIDSGRVNNVDGVFDEASQTFLLAGSNRTNTQVDVYRVTTEPVAIELERSFDVPLAEPYGLCVSATRIFVSDKDGLVQAWGWDGQGPLASYTFQSQTEGCVVDTENGHLYVGEETTGIWRVDLNSDSAPQLFASVDDAVLVADVEGLDIYTGDRGRVLIASSQGDSTFVAYNLATAEVLAKFSVTPGTGAESEAAVDAGVDGVQDTDGIAVTGAALADYPEGILVVQDGFNTNSNGSSANQNFKLIDWRDVAATFSIEQ